MHEKQYRGTFFAVFAYTANFPDFLHFTVLHSGQLPSDSINFDSSPGRSASLMRVVRAALMSFAVLLDVLPDISLEGGALLFLFSAWCSAISIPKAEQSVYNEMYPLSKNVLLKIEVGAQSNASSASSLNRGNV